MRIIAQSTVTESVPYTHLGYTAATHIEQQVVVFPHPQAFLPGLVALMASVVVLGCRCIVRGPSLRLVLGILGLICLVSSGVLLAYSVLTFR
jgi:hypothetical protein